MGRGFVVFCQQRTSDQDMHQQPFQAFIAELGQTSAKNRHIQDYLVVETTHLKNMRKSNWIICARITVKLKDI